MGAYSQVSRVSTVACYICRMRLENRNPPKKSGAEIMQELEAHHQHQNDPVLVEERVAKVRRTCEGIFLEVEQGHEAARERAHETALGIYHLAMDGKMDKATAVELITRHIEWLEDLGSKEIKFGGPKKSETYAMANALRSFRGDIAIAAYNELKGQKTA